MPNLDDFFQVPLQTNVGDVLVDVTSVVDQVQENQSFPPSRPALVVERKALADLKSSYGDGRYKDQKARLINCNADRVVLLGKRVVSSLLSPQISSFTERNGSGRI